MSEINNPYSILHLPEEATFEEIKNKYKHLSMGLHPDKQVLANYQMAKKEWEKI